MKHNDIFPKGYMLIVLVSVIMLFAENGKNEGDKATLTVVGFVNELEDSSWQDARIGMGLQAILSELFYASNEFALVEEKDAIKEEIRKTASLLWATGDKGKKIKEITEKASRDTRFLAWGRVFYFGRPRDKTSLGPMQITRDAVVIKVEVTLRDQKKKKNYIAVGKGVSATTAASILFTFHEKELQLDKTNVGNATREALEMAVNSLMKKYRKKYKRD